MNQHSLNYSMALIKLLFNLQYELYSLNQIISFATIDALLVHLLFRMFSIQILPSSQELNQTIEALQSIGIFDLVVVIVMAMDLYSPLRYLENLIPNIQMALPQLESLYHSIRDFHLILL
jgi:hypothetical protein